MASFRFGNLYPNHQIWNLTNASCMLYDTYISPQDLGLATKHIVFDIVYREIWYSLQIRQTKLFLPEAESKFWEALYILDYKFLLIPLCFFFLRIWACVQILIQYYIGVEIPTTIDIILNYLAVSWLVCLLWTGNTRFQTSLSPPPSLFLSSSLSSLSLSLSLPPFLSIIEHRWLLSRFC